MNCGTMQCWNNGRIPGLNRSVRGIACAGMVFVATMTVASSAQAQTAVVPPGAGTIANPYQISQIGHLVWIGVNVGSSSGKYYTVQNNIDASATAGWNGGAGFEPIGTNYTARFMGIFNGNGKVISNLKMARPRQTYVGLFGNVGRSGVVTGLGLEGGEVTGSNVVGSVVGRNYGTVSRCYSTCSVAGMKKRVGGLIGLNYGTVSWSHTEGPVSGMLYVGGLVGENCADGIVDGCCAIGTVQANTSALNLVRYLGGLVGYNSGTVRECYANGAVTGNYYEIGGLVGLNAVSGTIYGCYATGSVSGGYEVGGLVGDNSGTVNVCYATGGVRGSEDVGGLIGYNKGAVSECYATGGVSGYQSHGGIAGHDSGTTGSSYYDVQTTGQYPGLGCNLSGTSKTTAEMKRKTTFAGWDFVNVWRITENVTYPVLRQGHLQLSLQNASGKVLCWLMNTNGTLKSSFYIFTNATTWQVRAAGDVDKDGVADLIWQEPSGKVLCWLMAVNGAPKSSLNVLTNATTWQVRAAGDINKDGVADLIWQLPTGNVLCWLMNSNGTPKSGLHVSTNATTWQVRAAGDIDKDGVADLIWQLPTGEVVCWLMNANGTKKSGFSVLNTATTWLVRTAGDINKDGVADLIWQLPTGQVLCWLMNANGTAKSVFYIYNTPTSWLMRCAGW